MRWTRRDIVKLGVGVSATSVLAPLAKLGAQTAPKLVTKPIPSSGEQIPIVGIGTARRYEAATPEDRSEIKEVLRLLPELGGKLIDTAPSYGGAEGLVGELASELGNRDRLFLATKVGSSDKASGAAQIEESFQRLRTNRIDLIAVHNLRDSADQLATLRDLKQSGRVRYLGVTTSSDRQYSQMEAVLDKEKLDFCQVDYALDNRGAADRILPLAQERGIAVMINLPFGRGRLFSEVQNRPLPDWAAAIDCKTWAQIFLKYIVSHPAVTCAIPGTARVKYLEDNLGAAQGRLPDAAMRHHMEQFIDKL
jgi:aryl-alcohol dehydrogenase-like predicted oxidoreductase